MGPRAFMTAALAAAVVLLAPALARAQDAGVAGRGAYIFKAAGCLGCHTDVKNKGQPLAGGRAFKTEFGTFYSPNITPDPDTGIGDWTLERFTRALRLGLTADGSNYFPVFPYPSYTGMTNQDVADLFAFMKAQPAVRQENRAHDVEFPYGWRPGVKLWKWFYFVPGGDPTQVLPQDPVRLRGAYLVNVLGHCGECHTPRDRLGGPNTDYRLAGTAVGPEGGVVPNITPDPETGLGKWSEADLDSLFTIGMLPDGDFVGSGMGEVIDNTTSKWTVDDRKAVIAYLKGLAPIHHKVSKTAE